MSVEAYSIEQLYERLCAAETAYEMTKEIIPYHNYLKAHADYQRALIVQARARQGE